MVQCDCHIQGWDYNVTLLCNQSLTFSNGQTIGFKKKKKKKILPPLSRVESVDLKFSSYYQVLESSFPSFIFFFLSQDFVLLRKPHKKIIPSTQQTWESFLDVSYANLPGQQAYTKK